MTLENGQVLQSRYRIISLLGQGGMGAVYRAWDMRLDVLLALKEMIPQPGLDPQTLTQLRQQFHQEATILARLHHPHLVRVTDFFEEGGNAYLVMDFVEGESLNRLIARGGAVPEAQALAWAGQLLDALAYCHDQGLIHRDVKPQNVIVRPDGQAMLVDFGLVKLWNPRDPHTRTAMRGLGTPEYAPPEQYDAQLGHTDPRSDIYSVGATLYHTLTGQAPPTATMRIASPGLFQPPRMLNPTLSPTTDAAVLRATELAVGDRFASAREMAAALRGEVVAVAPPVMRHSQPTQAVAGAPPFPSTRRPGVPGWAWVVGGVVVLLLVAGLAGLAWIIGGRMGNRIVDVRGSPTPTPPKEEMVAASTPTEAEAPVTPVASPSPTSTHPPMSTSTGTPMGTPKHAASPTPTPTTPAALTAPPTPVLPTHTPRPTSPPSSGALVTFEQWAPWRRGDEPYGELTQTQERVHSGSYAARLRYDFPVTDKDYVVFIYPLSLAGQPNTIGAWVYGDGSGHHLNVWVQDAQDEVWSVHLGKVGGPGWQQMAGPLAPNLPWPAGHVSGPGNGAVDYPVRFYALVLDRPAAGPQSGQIYLDDISAWQGQAGVTATPPAAVATPASGGATPTATATSGPPVSGGPLDFPIPTNLDGWGPAETGHQATIMLHISGGAPPFTIYHELDVFVTQERDYALVFIVNGCSIVYTITVESADGQKVAHNYFIRAPDPDCD